MHDHRHFKQRTNLSTRTADKLPLVHSMIATYDNHGSSHYVLLMQITEIFACHAIGTVTVATKIALNWGSICLWFKIRDLFLVK